MEGRVSVTCQGGCCMNFSVVWMSKALGSVVFYRVHWVRVLLSHGIHVPTPRAIWFSHLWPSSGRVRKAMLEHLDQGLRAICLSQSPDWSCGGAWLKVALPFGHREAGRTRMAFSFWGDSSDGCVELLGEPMLLIPAEAWVCQAVWRPSLPFSVSRELGHRACPTRPALLPTECPAGNSLLGDLSDRQKKHSCLLIFL